MVGFSLKKDPADAPKKIGFGGFSLKKKVTANPPSALNKPKLFSKSHDDEDTIREVKIDTFDADKGGAFNKEDGPEQPKGPLVIKSTGNQNWRQVAKDRFNPEARKSQEPTEQKMSYGINFVGVQDKPSNSTSRSGPLLQKKEVDHFKQDVESRPDVSTLEEYEEIPVEDFGAAMLRGMGWKGNEDDEDPNKKKEVIPMAKRAPYLGLGAKAIDNGDTSKQRDKTYIPVKKIDRRTGNSIDESRERSPDRSSVSSYKTRS